MINQEFAKFANNKITNHTEFRKKHAVMYRNMINNCLFAIVVHYKKKYNFIFLLL